METLKLLGKFNGTNTNSAFGQKSFLYSVLWTEEHFLAFLWTWSVAVRKMSLSLAWMWESSKEAVGLLMLQYELAAYSYIRVEMGMETWGASLTRRELAESTYSFFAWCLSNSKNRTSNPSSLPSAGWRCSCPKSSYCQMSSVSGTPSLLMISALIFFCSSVVPCWRKYISSLPALLLPSFTYICESRSLL